MDQTTQRSGDVTDGRVDKARANARRHSGRVRALRILLPVLGLIVLLGMGGLIFVFNLLNSLGIGNVTLTSEGLVMDRPELSGNDGERTYRVLAERAIQRLTNPRIIDLEMITAEIVSNPEEKAQITSDKGTYDSSAETLRLFEGVRINWSGKYQIEFNSVDVDMKSGQVVTDRSMQVVSSGGDIAANGFTYDQENGIARFTDGIKMVLRPGASNTEKPQ
ncbi:MULTISPECIES: LPS export ABC transporter periplasmic protein LptC [unclassified Pannonibacter]|uniref:LPS export ABC transporter periplasmic protein LptC n=1 Tax=unclassified Pannonibacter TaxID=2627228 RepID=UPI0016485B97|nr:MULTISPECIES: LPS export ABC transporter periplasmic protein LptC [unclassified Pannonibacter]